LIWLEVLPLVVGLHLLQQVLVHHHHHHLYEQLAVAVVVEGPVGLSVAAAQAGHFQKTNIT